MNQLTALPFHVDVPLLFNRLHLEPDSEYADDIRSLAAKGEKAACPKALYGEARIEKMFEDGIQVRGIRFTSRTMTHNLRKTDRIYPYVCTCGAELDAIHVDPDDVFGQFCKEIIKEMALRQAVAALSERVLHEFGLDKKASMNPGSGDRKLWPIEEQKPLFRLLGNVEQAIGVHLTDSFLMLPNKSVSGFFFKTGKEFHNCQLCKRDACPNRQAPFDPVLWKKTLDEQGVDHSGAGDEDLHL